MLERAEPVLRVACLAFAGLIIMQLAWLSVRKDPLSGLRIPVTISAPAKVASPATTNSLAPTSAPVVKPEPIPGPVQARLDRIAQSEILGPIIRPPPMALLGIAGKDAFIRTDSGQTGLLREGEELGGVKLLQIGTNRVLVEHEGKKKELTIFSGLGSETLLQKGKDNPQ
jgi:hypothetical protein